MILVFVLFELCNFSVSN